MHKSKFPLLTWQFVAFGHNEYEIEKAKQLAKSLNMKFYVKLSWDEKISPIKNKQLLEKVSKLGIGSRGDYLKKSGRDYLLNKKCSQLWQNPQINWDGKILGCCFNYWDDFGNIFESNLTQGLNNEKMNYARQMLLGKLEDKKEIPCTRCGHYQQMKKHGNYLTIKDINSALSIGEKWPYIFGRLGVWITNKFSRFYPSI